MPTASKAVVQIRAIFHWLDTSEQVFYGCEAEAYAAICGSVTYPGFTPVLFAYSAACKGVSGHVPSTLTGCLKENDFGKREVEPLTKRLMRLRNSCRGDLEEPV